MTPTLNNFTSSINTDTKTTDIIYKKLLNSYTKTKHIYHQHSNDQSTDQTDIRCLKKVDNSITIKSKIK